MNKNLIFNAKTQSLKERGKEYLSFYNIFFASFFSSLRLCVKLSGFIISSTLK